MMAKFITAGNRSMREAQAQVRFWQEHYTTMAGLYLLGTKPLGKEKFRYLWFSQSNTVSLAYNSISQRFNPLKQCIHISN